MRFHFAIRGRYRVLLSLSQIINVITAFDILESNYTTVNAILAMGVSVSLMEG